MFSVGIKRPPYIILVVIELKKKKPVAWIVGAVVAVGIVSGAVGGSENSFEDEQSPAPSFSSTVSSQPTESVFPSFVPSEEPSFIPSEEPSSEPVPSEDPSSSPVITVTYIASAESDKCHTERCRFVGDILEENIIYFHSKEEAINAGYSACGTCKPW
ncbi:MAG: hypothetical protein IJ311_03130 [Elusimicrobiaceae bacterium]|nr:hypothetical protein [Elusimicrobiaceae bacterium]